MRIERDKPASDSDDQPVSRGVAPIFTGLNGPAAAPPTITLLQKGIGPVPHQRRCGFHADVLHHTQVQSTHVVQALPLNQQRIISVDQKGVVKLLAKLLLKGPKAGEIDNEATFIQMRCRKPKREASAVAVNKTAVALVPPLAVTTGIPLEQLAAAETGGWSQHDEWEEAGWISAAGSGPKPVKQRPDAAPQPSLHRPTPF